jgi:hypothetical protein
LYRRCNYWVGCLRILSIHLHRNSDLASPRRQIIEYISGARSLLPQLPITSGKGTSLIVSGVIPGALIGICPNRQLHFEEVHALGIERRHKRIVGPT